MDYRRFLSKVEERVLPHFGGRTLTAPDRRLRLREPVAAGWYLWRTEGRAAAPLGPAEPDLEGLEGLARVRGHLLGARLVGEDARPSELFFLPDDEPPAFAPATARRWTSGELIFEGLELEAEAEEAARQALEDGRSLADVRGAPASLRAAFAFALAERAAAALGVGLSPLEVRAQAATIAEGGPEAALEVVRALEARRQAYRAARPSPAAGALRPGPRGDVDDAERVEAALVGADARLLRLRRRGGDQLEVTFRFLGARYQALVAADTLRVIDAGICLSGEDDRLGLDALPGVIREAIETDALHVTRWVEDFR